jgi:hypothetical protein
MVKRSVNYGGSRLYSHDFGSNYDINYWENFKKSYMN